MTSHHLESLSSLLSPSYDLIKESFEPTNENHTNLLKQLWTNINPEIKLKNLISEQWSEIGFQGKNPQTDFRGMGLKFKKKKKKNLISKRYVGS